jgi:hypothetical protein
MSYCRNITDAGIKALATGCTQLQSLDISECPNISDAGREIAERINRDEAIQKQGIDTWFDEERMMETPKEAQVDQVVEEGQHHTAVHVLGKTESYNGWHSDWCSYTTEVYTCCGGTDEGCVFGVVRHHPSSTYDSKIGPFSIRQSTEKRDYGSYTTNYSVVKPSDDFRYSCCNQPVNFPGCTPGYHPLMTQKIERKKREIVEEAEERRQRRIWELERIAAVDAAILIAAVEAAAAKRKKEANVYCEFCVIN